MTDRDRLIELLVNFRKPDNPIVQMAERRIIERIADYLLANGVVVPPCKVWDKVYWINHVTKEIETDIVISIHQYENGLSITTDTVGTKGTTTFSLNRFLEIMHFTKEEAEEKLKEREG